MREPKSLLYFSMSLIGSKKNSPDYKKHKNKKQKSRDYLNPYQVSGLLGHKKPTKIRNKHNSKKSNC